MFPKNEVEKLTHFPVGKGKKIRKLKENFWHSNKPN